MKIASFIGIGLLSIVMQIADVRDLSAQVRQAACKDIDRIKAEVNGTTRKNEDGKITLIFPEGIAISNFRIELFAPKRASNKTNLTNPVIEGLSKGKYYLIIQSVNNDDCTRKITLEIN